MKILMGNNTLSLLAGSETWTLTMANEFKRQGHDVSVYSPDLGLIATKLEAEDIKCVKELNGDNNSKPFSPILEEGLEEPDVIICNHYEITRYLRQKYPNTPIIATIHGILHKHPDKAEIWPEHPALDSGVNKFVAVSEEVRDMLKNEYNIDADVIRNGFDLERFKKTGKIKSKPEIFLVNSNYWGVKDDVNKIIKEVAVHYGAQLQGIGQNFVQTYEVEKIIEQVDVVFGMGRSLLEGMCMGKLAVCHGRWGTAGVVTPDNVKEIRKYNFSGRNSKGKFMSAKEIVSQIDKCYTETNADIMDAHIHNNHDIKVTAKKYINIAKKLIK